MLAPVAPEGGATPRNINSQHCIGSSLRSEATKASVVAIRKTHWKSNLRDNVGTLTSKICSPMLASSCVARREKDLQPTSLSPWSTHMCEHTVRQQVHLHGDALGCPNQCTVRMRRRQHLPNLQRVAPLCEIDHVEQIDLSRIFSRQKVPRLTNDFAVTTHSAKKLHGVRCKAVYWLRRAGFGEIQRSCCFEGQ